MTTAQRRFEWMVRALSADVYRYAYALCRNGATAEDLVQETFTRAWRSFEQLRDESKAKSWLLTTVRREHARRYERFQPEVAELDPDELPGAREEDPDVATLRRAIAALPLRYREVIALQVIGGYDGAELAEMLGVPRATVNTRLFRARQRLAEALAAEASPARAGQRETR